MEKITKSEEEWRAILTPEQYRIMREKATESPFCGLYLGDERKGTYVCAACSNPLFSSKTKFHSGTGWPSYFQPINKEAVYYKEDTSHGMMRTEVLCSVCDSHLGHIFEDGPPPTGKRYCINSIALKFEPEE